MLTRSSASTGAGVGGANSRCETSDVCEAHELGPSERGFRDLGKTDFWFTVCVSAHVPSLPPFCGE